MSTETTVPTTLREAIIHFSDPKVCHDLLLATRFPNGVCCVHCGAVGPKFMESVQRFKCYSCRKQFSLKTGTVLEDSPIPLTKWFPAFWLLTSAKNGISSYELHRALGVTQKTAWFMLHRIRHIFATGTFEKLAGVVEADETFIGGLEKNKHKDKKSSGTQGGAGKSVVLGILERSSAHKVSQVRVKLGVDRSKDTLHNLLGSNIEQGSTLYTDAHKGYMGISAMFAHDFIDHAVTYAKGAVHTNGMENYWSLMKRTMKGTYTHCEPFHLTKYIDEQAYRFNTRSETDGDRFVDALSQVSGKRLTYEALTSSHEAYYDEFMPRVDPADFDPNDAEYERNPPPMYLW
ncbi:MAG TPA: IS1595 family transposase [Capsulimonadaceae bacterium]